MSEAFNFNATPKKTMIRISDPKRSMAFYDKHFGMKFIHKMDVNEIGFSIYYLGPIQSDVPWHERKELLELNHNHYSQNFPIEYATEKPTPGSGHISFSVENLHTKCDKLIANGVEVVKAPSDNSSKVVAFAIDPDGYWVELIGQKPKSIFSNWALISVGMGALVLILGLFASKSPSFFTKIVSY